MVNNQHLGLPIYIYVHENIVSNQTGCIPKPGRRYSIPMTARRIILIGAAMLTAGLCFAQFRNRREIPQGPPGSGHLVRIEGGLVVNEDEIHTAREVGSHSSGTPEWTNAPGFEGDVFTFTR